MKAFLLVTLLALPAGAFTPDELLGSRQVSIDCPDGKDYCTVPRKDMEWIVSRDRLTTKLLEIAGRQMQQCTPRGI